MALQQKIDEVNVITAPEIEMLIIHAEGAYDQFKRSGKKPSEFCKTNLRMHDVKSYDFVKQYFSNPQLLVKAIKEYRRTANIPKGEYRLSDLLRWALLFWYISRDSNGHQEINGYQFTENRIESSSMSRWETNGVFFAQIRLYRTLKSQNEP